MSTVRYYKKLKTGNIDCESTSACSVVSDTLGPSGL